MALDSIGLFPIRIDLYKKHKTTTVYANEGDINGRGLTVTLVKDDYPFDATGLSLKLGFLNAKGEERLYDFTEVNAKIGKYQLIYPRELIDGNGGSVVNVEIKAYEIATDRVVSYNPLYVYVSSARITEGRLLESSEGSAMTNMLKEIVILLAEAEELRLGYDIGFFQKTVSSPTEPILKVGDMWHKEV